MDSKRQLKVSRLIQKELSQLSTIEAKQAKKVFQGNIKTSKIDSYTLDEILLSIPIFSTKLLTSTLGLGAFVSKMYSLFNFVNSFKTLIEFL